MNSSLLAEHKPLVLPGAFLSTIYPDAKSILVEVNLKTVLLS